ncbi:MAG: class I SAM-dependent methyltransferase [Candidatus Neomarinimicrobiota bacterium]|nr:class I SAM-dependent methyltransferase [Candidatus Neomarinimicrobiota bacterium]|tara:strand:- start:560 stop:1222 length:663 start_codon:yes stop_codon:yes gene_type:complete
MSSNTIELNQSLRDYLINVSVKESGVLKDLREETLQLDEFQMQISPEQGSFLSFLVKLINAKHTLDIGVFTGYSSLVVALQLPQNGYVTACDTNEEWTEIAQKYWKAAKVEDNIDLHIAPAVETLEKLISNGNEGLYDFSFIDADKINYQHYFEQSLVLVRKGGVIAIDNVLWGGRVLDNSDTEPATRAIREFNSKLYKDDRVAISMIPIGDGLTLAQKL